MTRVNKKLLICQYTVRIVAQLIKNVNILFSTYGILKNCLLIFLSCHVIISEYLTIYPNFKKENYGKNEYYQCKGSVKNL